LTDGNQALAAEPGFHSDPPRGGGFEVTAIRRLSEHRSELQRADRLYWRDIIRVLKELRGAGKLMPEGGHVSAMI